MLIGFSSSKEGAVERRVFPRLKSCINARLLINQERDGEGVLYNFSASGAAVKSNASVALGDQVVLHLEGGSRFEGAVARVFEDGFALEFGMCESKRRRLINALEPKLKDQEEITSLSIRHRMAERIGGLRMKTVCHTESGEIECRLVDVSLTGAALETDAALSVGDDIMIGQTRGKVIRRDGSVYGVQFAPEAMLDDPDMETRQEDDDADVPFPRDKSKSA